MTSGHRFSPRRAFGIPVIVQYGTAMYIGPDDDVHDATARLRATMQRLLHEIQECYPDGAPQGAWWVPARLGGGAPAPSGAADRRPVAEPGPSSEPPFGLLEPADPVANPWTPD